MSTISSISKDLSSAFGSLGSIYQTSGIGTVAPVVPIAPVAALKIKQPETNMDKLISMGFANRNLNNQLLKKHDNDLDKVISSLLEQQESNYR